MPEPTLEQAVGKLAGMDLLLGFSGGLDSTVLLHATASHARALQLNLRAIHVDHGLHAGAADWARHCIDVCVELGVELVVERVSVIRDGGRGMEAAAREARYAAFLKHLRAHESLALAHHRDDQAETVLLRLLRASGSSGLAAMLPSRPFGVQVLLRPLLDVSRSRLLEYAQAQNLRWIDDPTNLDERLDRNFLRHRVLPSLHERWPQAAVALARSAELLAEDAGLLDAVARQHLDQVRGPGPMQVKVTALLAFERPWRARILRRWLADSGLPALPGKAIRIIESDLLDARPDCKAEVRWEGAVLRRWRDCLHLDALADPLPLDWQCEWDGRKPLLLPTGDALAFVSVDCEVPPRDEVSASADASLLAELHVRARRGGEKITLPGRSHRHALKQCMQDAGIPPWRRDRLPLLLAGDGELLAAGDLLISARLDRFCRSRSLRLQCRPAQASAGD